MNPKLLIHLCILLVLVCFTFLKYSSAKKAAAAPPPAQEQAYDEDYDEDYDSVKPSEADNSADVMLATAFPLILTMIYAGFLVVTYLLPSAVDKMSEEMYGSTACLLYTSPSPRDRTRSRMPSSA